MTVLQHTSVLASRLDRLMHVEGIRSRSSAYRLRDHHARDRDLATGVVVAHHQDAKCTGIRAEWTFFAVGESSLFIMMTAIAP